MTILKMWKNNKYNKPWYKSDSAYLYMLRILIIINTCAGKHTNNTIFLVLLQYFEVYIW